MRSLTPLLKMEAFPWSPSNCAPSSSSVVVENSRRRSHVPVQELDSQTRRHLICRTALVHKQHSSRQHPLPRPLLRRKDGKWSLKEEGGNINTTVQNMLNLFSQTYLSHVKLLFVFKNHKSIMVVIGVLHHFQALS